MQFTSIALLFTGCCVGYHNHRYFLSALLYVFIGAVYGVCFQWDYVFSTINLPLVYFIMTLIAPHFALLFGAISLWGLIVATLHTMAIVCLMMVTYLLLVQIRGIYRGQTQYEMKHDIHDYNLSIHQNLVDVMGRKWKIAWLSPFINSPLKGDGINFLKVTDYEPPKDI